MQNGTIGEICTREVIVATRDTTVAQAAQLMRGNHVGTLVVCDSLNGGGRLPVGIVTDRDIVVGVVAPGLDAGTIKVDDIMGGELVTVREPEGLLQALEIMRYKGVRRLPVVEEDGRLAGIVSIDDLLGILAEGMADITKIIGRERGIEAANRK